MSGYKRKEGPNLQRDTASSSSGSSNPKKMKMSKERSPSSSPEPTRSIWSGGSITAAELKNLKTSNKKNLFVLLVDCRGRDNRFNSNEQISGISWVTFPSLSSTDKSRFATKVAVVNFFYKQYWDILKVLNAPGSYTHIIVFDDNSTPKDCSPTVFTVLTAIQEWNKSTRTVTLLLDKGFSNFKHENAEMVETFEDLEKLPFHLSYTLEECPLLFQPLHPNTIDNDNDAEEIKNILYELVTQLRFVIAVTIELLRLRKTVCSLEAIKVALKEEFDVSSGSDDELDIAVPGGIQCPVCFNLFTEEIFQCSNGHSLCLSCYKDLSACPECRAPYPTGGGIRNRALEHVISAVETVDCPFRSHGCGKRFSYHQVDTHTKSCDYGVFSAVANINRLLLGEKYLMNNADKNLKRGTKNLTIAEAKWKTSLISWNTPPDMAQLRLEYVTDVLKLKADLLNLEMNLLACSVEL